MLEKLAAVANFADQHGEYEVASDLTYLVKNAQLFDALRSLFDPSTSELGADSSWWKRLTRGWQKGKFDRRLGLALAINAERTKLNKKIEELAAPLKEFSAQVADFYDKVKSGGDNYSAMDFKAELSKLKSDAAKMKNLVGGRDLRRALDLRNKLNAQQISAVEKIKGIDPEHKDFLIKLLNGEIKSSSPEAEKAEKVPGEKAPEVYSGDKITPEQQRIRAWLKDLPMPKMSYDEGLTSKRSRGLAWTIYSRWGVSPMAMKVYFDANPAKQEEGALLFGKPFRKVFIDIADVLKLEALHGEKKDEQKVEKAEQAQEKAKEVVEQTAPPAPAPEKKAPAVAPVPAAVEPIKVMTPEEKAEVERKGRTSRDVQIAKETGAPQGKGKGKGKKKEPLPEEMTPRPSSPANDNLSLAATATQRLEREITRLGRMQKLRKLAQLDPLENDDFEMAEEMGMLAPEDEDVYMIPSDRLERFDEEKDYDPAQTGVEMYHGPDVDPDDWGWNRRIRKEKVTPDSLLAKMEQFGRLWRSAPDEGARALIQQQLDKLQAEYDLIKDKDMLVDEEAAEELEGWADDK